LIESRIFTTTDAFLPLTFRLDIVADFVQFLKTSDDGLWLVKLASSNCGRGIEMVRDVGSYKEALMTKKNKWGESAIKLEEVKNVIAAVTDEGS